MSHDLQNRIRNLLAHQNLGVLGTSDSGHPYTSLVVYAELPTLARLVFFTRRDRTKYRNLKSDSRVSMYIDSREKWQRDPATVEGLSIIGVAWEIKRTSDEFLELKELYLEKNPHMEAFVNDSDSNLFRINVESYKYVVNFDEAYELII